MVEGAVSFPVRGGEIVKERVGKAVMRPALQDLLDFYASPLGHVARHMIAQRIRSRWGNVRGQRVAGVGYATPYLRALKAEAERVIALMPRPQGVIHWPPRGRNIAAMFDEPDLPLPDASMDCLMAVHCLEMSDNSEALLREFWRVLRPEGRLMLVLPNRTGLWARADHTPIGAGHPYSERQITGRWSRDVFAAGEPALRVHAAGWLARLAACRARVGAHWPARLAGVVRRACHRGAQGTAWYDRPGGGAGACAPALRPAGRCARRWAAPASGGVAT